MTADSPRRPSVVCLGGATVDRTYRLRDPLEAATSNPASAGLTSFGGVARNVAEALARLDVPTTLVSVVGDDEPGRALAAHLESSGVHARLRVAGTVATAEYVAVLQPSGELAFGLAAMEVLDAFAADLVDEAWPLLAGATWVFADCNLPGDTLRHLIARRRDQERFKLAVDAVSTVKARRLPDDLLGVDLLFANRDEARAIAGPDVPDGSPEALARALRARGAAGCVVTLGPDGALAADADDAIAMLPAVGAAVVDVTGAGDALIAGTLAKLVAGALLPEALRTGLLAAALAVETRGSVRPDLSRGLLGAAGRRIQEV